MDEALPRRADHESQRDLAGHYLKKGVYESGCLPLEMHSCFNIKYIQCRSQTKRPTEAGGSC